MHKILILLAVLTLALTTFAQESNVINKIKNRVASTPPPPPEPVVRPPRTNVTPVVAPPKTNHSNKVVVSRNAIHLVLQRPLTMGGLNQWIAKYPNSQRWKDEKEQTRKKFEAALIESVKTLTNAQDIIVYRSAVAFWNTNHQDSMGNVVPGPPPEDQRYFSPEVSMITNSAPSQ